MSPLFLVCVHDKTEFQFSKPVTVTLPHFLNLEKDDDIQSLGLTFLRADQNKNSEGLYEFQPTDGDMDFKTCTTSGIFKTTQVSCFCIAAKDLPNSHKDTQFLITAVLPRHSLMVGKHYFFITFNLKACLKKWSIKFNRVVLLTIK